MSIKNLRTTLLVAALTAAVPAAMAVKINGSIAFNGSTLLDAPIPGATSFMSFTDTTVSAGTQTGDYLGTGGTAVMMEEPIIFSPFMVPSNPVWSFSDDGKDYSFYLYSLASVERSSLGAGLFQLTVAGLGMASITGYDDTEGAFSITTTGNAEATALGFGAFSFTTERETVPDGGSAAMLLGLGVLGVGLAQRKLKRAPMAS